MSSWNAKLERVRNVGIALQNGGNFAPSVTTDPARPLDVLRDRIAAILAKAPAPKPPRADPTVGDLPFVREETDLGPLYVRQKRLSVAHRVGRASVQAGASASAGMLALLALAPG